MKNIAVIGATGMLGAPVADELAKAGFNVRAIVRNMTKAKEKLSSSIELKKGDLKDVESLMRGFQDADAVYLSLSTEPGEKNRVFRTEVEGLENVLEAARLTGIKRIGYLSSLVQNYQDINWWVFDIKRTACRTLKAAKLPVTIFYPSNFMENFPELHITGNRIILMGQQKTKSWYISASDYGRQVAESFKREGEDDREYVIQGPEPFNFREAAEVFSENYKGKDLKISTIPIGLIKFFGLFSKQANYVAKIMEAINHYDEQFMASQTWEELGKPQITLSAFARSC